MKTTILGQFVLLVLIAAALAWSIGHPQLPQDIEVEWRGFHAYHNPATLRNEIQWWPVSFHVVKSKAQQMQEAREAGRDFQQRHWEAQREQELQRMKDDIECLKRGVWYRWGPC